MRKFLILCSILLLTFTVTSCELPSIEGGLTEADITKLIEEELKSQTLDEDYINQRLAELDLGDTPVDGLSSQISALVGSAEDSVVGIINDRSGIGSGVVYKKTGTTGNYTYYVITNEHVTEGSLSSLEVCLSGSTSNCIEASEVSDNNSLLINNDISVLTFDYAGDIPLMPFASNIKYGELAFAIGSPLSIDKYFNSVTIGLVSNYDIAVHKTDLNSICVQTDAAINPGNSGGALINSKGELIGINTFKITQSSSNEYDIDNMGYAIQVDRVIYLLQSIHAY